MAIGIRGIGRRLRRAGIEVEQRRATSLLGEIEGDETISDITRGELLGQIGQASDVLGGQTSRVTLTTGRKSLDEITATLGRAREGGGIFAGRQQQKQRRSILADRPGRAQTILTR